MRTRGHARALVGIALSVAMLACAHSVAADGASGQPGGNDNDNPAGNDRGSNHNDDPTGNDNRGGSHNDNPTGNDNRGGNHNDNPTGNDNRGGNHNDNPARNDNRGGKDNSNAAGKTNGGTNHNDNPARNDNRGTHGPANTGRSGNGNTEPNGDRNAPRHGNSANDDPTGSRPPGDAPANAPPQGSAQDPHGNIPQAPQNPPPHSNDQTGGPPAHNTSGSSHAPGPGASKTKADNTVTADNGSPVAIFDYEFTSRYDLYLDASRSFANEGSLVDHTWIVTGYKPLPGTSLNLELPGDGGYLVILQVTDERGRTDTAALAFQLQPPYVHFNSDPIVHAEVLPRGSLVHLDATASVDPDGDPLKYQWTIDGTDVGAAPRLQHDFPENGHHNVALTVHDPYGGTATVEHPVEIAVTAPPHIMVDLWSGAFLDEPVFLDASASWSREAGPLSFDWRVDEHPEIHSTEPMLIFQPTEAGELTIHLTVTTPSGLSDTHIEELDIIDWWDTFESPSGADDASFSVSVAADEPGQARSDRELAAPPSLTVTLIALAALGLRRQSL